MLLFITEECSLPTVNNGEPSGFLPGVQRQQGNTSILNKILFIEISIKGIQSKVKSDGGDQVMGVIK